MDADRETGWNMSEEPIYRNLQQAETAEPAFSEMSRSAKIFLGILTFWPGFYIVIFLLFIFLSTFLATDSSSSENENLLFGILIVVHMLTMLEILGLTIFYAVNVYRDKVLLGDRKTLWMVIVLLGGFLGQAAYFVLWIVKRSPLASGTAEPGTPMRV